MPWVPRRFQRVWHVIAFPCTLEWMQCQIGSVKQIWRGVLRSEVTELPGYNILIEISTVFKTVQNNQLNHRGRSYWSIYPAKSTGSCTMRTAHATNLDVWKHGIKSKCLIWVGYIMQIYIRDMKIRTIEKK